MLLFVREPVPCDVVEEEERLGATGHDVVDAVADDIEPAKIEAVCGELELHLGADTVGTGREHRVAVLLTEAEEPRERTGVAEDFGTAGLGEDTR